MIRAVFFDIGSTLVTGPNAGVAKRMAARLGLSVPEKERVNAALMTRDFVDAAAVAGFMRDELGSTSPDVEATVSDIWNAQLTEASTIAGALESLKAWADTGVTICLISNIWQPYQVSAINALGPALDDLAPASGRIYSYQIGVAKPTREPFLRALAIANCAPAEAIMVGDSYREDIEPAIALGLSTAWILRRAEREIDNLTRVLNGLAPTPDLTVDDIGSFSPASWRERAARRVASR